MSGIKRNVKPFIFVCYIFYYNERIFGGIYEPGFMVKITEASRKYMPNAY